jgi:hypothetical protein
MNVKRIPVVLLATGLMVLLGQGYARAGVAGQQDRDYQDRDRDREHRHFTDHDRGVLMGWYRDNAERFEPRGDEQRWNNEEVEQRLRQGSTLDDEMRRWARPLPDELESRLDALPGGWRYMRVGYNVVIVDRDQTVRDIFHFDQFNDRDRDTIRQWNRDHQSAVNQFLGNFGVRTEQGDLDRRLQVGNVVDQDLQSRARPAPDDLVNRLTPPPRGWQYVVIGDRLVLVDRDWRIHESFLFQH